MQRTAGHAVHVKCFRGETRASIFFFIFFYYLLFDVRAEAKLKNCRFLFLSLCFFPDLLIFPIGHFILRRRAAGLFWGVVSGPSFPGRGVLAREGRETGRGGRPRALLLDSLARGARKATPLFGVCRARFSARRESDDAAAGAAVGVFSRFSAACCGRRASASPQVAREKVLVAVSGASPVTSSVSH